MLQASPQKINFQRLPPYLSLQLGNLVLFPPWLPVAGKCADSMIAKLPPPPVQHVRVYFTRPRHLGDTRAQFQSPYGGLFELLGE
jgi:hypothetical protein